MPVSATVPSPLKFLGYVPGEPGHLTYHADIVRYYEALEKASPRVKLFRIGKSEEGRDMVALAIADEATIKQLDKYKQITAQLTDPRKLSDAEAKQLIATGKPIYYATGSIHTPETGSPEMLIELAFRLAVEESAVRPDDPQQHDRRAHAGDRSGRPREGGRQLQLRAWRTPASRRPAWSTGASTCSTTTTATASASACTLTQNMLKTLPRLAPDRVPRPARVGDAALRLDRHRPVQHRRRSDPDQRVVAARAERDDGDGQAQRAGRVDLQLLRRLGPELHVLDRRHAQLDRPLLRDAELQRPELRWSAATRAASGTGPTRRRRASCGGRAPT